MKFENVYLGQLVLHEGFPYQIVEIDEDDKTVAIANTNGETSFWVEMDEIQTHIPPVVTKQFIVEITVDEHEIISKYPNYWINYGKDTEKFIKSVANDLKFIAGEDMSKGIDKWGYSIKVKKI